MISIVDIGSGNISSFQNSYKRMGIPTQVVKTKKQLLKAKKILLPGVGSYDSFMNKLNLSGLKETLNRQVLENQVPILGICVGMQVLGDLSEEGKLPGLSYIKGKVLRFSSDNNLPVPAMGWNPIEVQGNYPLFESIDPNLGYYFLHSYYFTEEEELTSKAISQYGQEFTCAIQKNNIFGVQFHPEKSHQNGAKLLRNFSEVVL